MSLIKPYLVSFALVVTVALACSDGSSSLPLESLTGLLPKLPVPTSISFRNSPPPVIISGMQATIGADVTDVSGVVVNVPITWLSSSNTVATVVGGPGSGAILEGRSEGTVTITAMAGTKTATATVRVVTDPPPSAALRIESFLLLRFGDTSTRSVLYAPLVRLKETTGARSAEIIGVRFAVPGGNTLLSCRGSVGLTPGMAADLFRIDSEGLSFMFAGPQIPGGSVTAKVYFVEPNGTVGQTQVTAAVSEGSSYTAVDAKEPLFSWGCIDR